MPSPPLVVSLVQTEAELEALRDEWNRLFQECETSNLFDSWTWHSLWWKHFAQSRQLLVIVVYEAGKVIGILPLARYDHVLGPLHRVRYLHFIGFRYHQRWNDWIDVLATDKQKVVRAAMDCLLQKRYLWDVIDLWDIPEGSDTIPAFQDAADHHHLSFEYEDVDVCPRVNTCGDWHAYYEHHIAKKLRADIDRQNRRLESKGRLEVKWPTQRPAIRDNLECLFRLHEKRQAKMRQQTSQFADATFRHFYRSLTDALPQHQVECPILLLDDNPIAAHLSFVHSGDYYYCTPAFHPDYRNYSPGIILLKETLRRCFEDKRIHTFDFLRGNEGYKLKWATETKRECRIKVRASGFDTFRGKLSRRLPDWGRRVVVTPSNCACATVEP